jgi:CRISPR-associated protein Csx17
MSDKTVVRLPGCRPEPLASYLKALALFRLVGDQKDPEARGWWENDLFCLKTALDEGSLLKFLLYEYVPTPIVAPWNGASGFFPNDRKSGIAALRESTHPRFSYYREAICLSEQILSRLGINSPPSGAPQKEIKRKLLLACRRGFSDESLTWIDAAYVLTAGGVQFPPLLGTGGNDGHLEFTNNFMQRLVEMIDPSSGEPTGISASLCRAALWSLPTAGLQRDLPIGQFLPGGAGGANAGPGYDAQSLVNPWDFILLMEGALFFGAAVCKRMQVAEPGVLSAPFTVRPSLAGYASAAPDDDARAEIWLPLWERPATLNEVKMLFSEGRSQVGRRSSRDGVDFARAIATLGVDRGISSFQRMGFIERNGQAYLSTPLGRWSVLARPEVNLVEDLDRWLDRFRQVALSPRSPSSLSRALRKIETAILGVCRDAAPSQWQRLIDALGDAEKQMAKSPQTTQSTKLSPLPRLRPQWLKQADDGSPEFRLAASLASIYDATLGPLRANMVPLDPDRYYRAFNLDKMDANDVVWGRGSLAENLLAVLERRLLGYRRGELEELPLKGRQPADLDDVRNFIKGAINETKLEGLLWGLNAVDWQRVQPTSPRPRGEDLPVPGAYALLRLAHHPGTVRLDRAETGVKVPLDPAILARARTGQIAAACRLASRRLRASGLIPKMDEFRCSGETGQRIAAALLFPLRESDISYLGRMVIKASV